MHSEHHVVFIPGLMDQDPIHKKFISLLPFVWQRFGLLVHIVYPEWEKGNSFKPKLERILIEIDSLLEQGYVVSVAGQSAGGSAGGNAFMERKQQLAGFVNITGRLKEGGSITPTLAYAAKNSPAFTESVILFEHSEPGLSASDRKRVLTIRPSSDSVVPASTAAVDGATNLVGRVPGHVLGGVFIDIFYAKRIAQFLGSIVVEKTT